MSYEIISAFLCDDVRKEESGKLFFIGSYTGSFRLRKEHPDDHDPVDIEVCLICIARGSEVGKFPVEIKIKIPGSDEEIGKAFVRISNVDEQTFVIVSGVPLQLKESGLIEFSYKKEDSFDYIPIFNMPLIIEEPVG